MVHLAIASLLLLAKIKRKKEIIMKTLLKLLILIFPLFLFAAPDLTVTNLHLTSPNDGRSNPTFAWDVNANASGYEVSSDSGLNWTDVGNVTTYTFRGLSNGNYNVVVRAYASAVSVPLFGGLGVLLLVTLFGITATRRIKANS